MSDVKVSVCCLAYNHQPYIRQCLEGFVMQKCNFTFEVLIHDDASTDNTAEIIKEYEIKYSEIIKPIYQTENQHSRGVKPTPTFNFPRARGKYIALCEGDDYWTDTLKLQKQIDFLENNPDYVLCFHPCNFLEYLKDSGQNVLRIQKLNTIQYEYSFKNLLKKWGIPTASLVFRNEIKELPSWFSRVASGDIGLVMMLFEKGKFKLLEEHMSIYRITGKGVSQTHEGYRMIHYRAVLYSHLNEYFEFRYEKEIYEALDFIYHQFSQTTQQKIKKASAIRRFFKLLNK